MLNLIILLFLSSFIVLALYVRRKYSLSDFLSYRSGSSEFEIVLTLLASLVGGWMFFGLVAIGFEAGAVGYLLGIGYGIGLLVLFIFTPRIKSFMTEYGCDTLDDYVRLRFGKRTQITVTIVNLMFFVAVIGSQFIALDAFLRIFPDYINGNIVFYFTALSVVAYTALSGFRGVLLTDKWQFVGISLSAVVIFLVLASHSDLSKLSGLPSRYLNGTGYGLGFIVAALVFFPLTFLARSDLWQRISSARSSDVARRGILATIPLLFLFYFMFVSIGVFARLAMSESTHPASSGLALFQDYIAQSPGLASDALLLIVALGVVSALISTIDTNLNVISVAILRTMSKFNVVDGSSASISRGNVFSHLGVITAIVGGLAFILSLLVPDIVNLIVSAGAMLLIFTPAIVYGVVTGGSVHDSATKGSAAAAFFSILVAFLGFLVLFIFLDPKIAFLPAAVLSLVLFFGILGAQKLRGGE